ncbi:hypothetical protein [Bdellovibrio bacteriovorus]|uniref:hypothetical protein n=1 Tax=Bdellovibrio bacteriovorus TaxID=959 RepID=UPI0035A57D63
MGEVYSETTYVPQYGLLTESYLRLMLVKKEKFATYVGASIQVQNKTRSAQDDLYDKNRAMALVGGRFNLWKNLFVLAELRTEERSRGGLYLGDMWQYPVANQNMFSEFYAESMILPSFHNDPVSTAWFKQGLRFSPAQNIFLDAFVELYLRRSPDPDLGRDTEQARAGLRGIYLIDSWSVAALLYQSFPRNEASHEEGLLVIGGSF